MHSATIPLIHNPAARSQKSARLGRLLAQLEPAPRILVTDGQGSARQLAAECARKGEATIVAAGGDGTLNEVVAGLLDAAAEGHAMPRFGVMPLGTMNVFALELGLPVRNVRQCWDAIVGGTVREVDVWIANGGPMIQLGGVGLDATVVAETTWDLKRRMGAFSYVINAARVLARPAPKLTITVDGTSIEGAMVLFGNGMRYGGPIKVFGNAKPDDGLLDVMVLRQQSAGDVLGFVAALATGNLENFPGVWFGHGKHVTVTSPRPVAIELDGEAAGTTPLEITASPIRLRVHVPGSRHGGGSR